MIKVIDNTARPTRRTTLSAIPSGEIFRGTILLPKAGPITGVFYKAEGPWVPTSKAGYRLPDVQVDVCVVQIDHDYSRPTANVFMHDREVTNYEPLDATLTVIAKGQD